MSDWDRKSRLGGWAGGWAEKAEVSTGQFSGLDKFMILLRKSVIAGQDLNLRPSGYET